MHADLRLQSTALVLLLLIGTIGAPASAQQAHQDPKQPSVDNPHMHIYGSSDLSNCFTHFDGNDTSGSDPQGYGERGFSQGQQVQVDYSCRIQETFKQDMYLNPNGTILVEMAFNIDSADCDQNNPCTNLTIILSKGTQEVARNVWPVESVNSRNDELLRWEIPVNETMERWNRSIEEPEIQVLYSAPGTQGLGCGLIFDCSGYFRMYYSNNENNDSVEINFPVINQTIPGEGGNEGGLGGVSDALPGFGLIGGVAALAMAALVSGRFLREDRS